MTKALTLLLQQVTSFYFTFTHYSAHSQLPGEYSSQSLFHTCRCAHATQITMTLTWVERSNIDKMPCPRCCARARTHYLFAFLVECLNHLSKHLHCTCKQIMVLFVSRMTVAVVVRMISLNSKPQAYLSQSIILLALDHGSVQGLGMI